MRKINYKPSEKIYNILNINYSRSQDKLADFEIAISELELNPRRVNIVRAYDTSRKAMENLLVTHMVLRGIPKDKSEMFNDLSLRCEQAIGVVEELDPYTREYESENGSRYVDTLAKNVEERAIRLDILNTGGAKAFLDNRITNGEGFGQMSDSMGAA